MIVTGEIGDLGNVGSPSVPWGQLLRRTSATLTTVQAQMSIRLSHYRDPHDEFCAAERARCRGADELMVAGYVARGMAQSDAFVGQLSLHEFLR